MHDFFEKRKDQLEELRINFPKVLLVKPSKEVIRMEQLIGRVDRGSGIYEKIFGENHDDQKL